MDTFRSVWHFYSFFGGVRDHVSETLYIAKRRRERQQSVQHFGVSVSIRTTILVSKAFSAGSVDCVIFQACLGDNTSKDNDPLEGAVAGRNEFTAYRFIAAILTGLEFIPVSGYSQNGVVAGSHELGFPGFFLFSGGSRGVAVSPASAGAISIGPPIWSATTATEIGSLTGASTDPAFAATR